MSYLLELLQDHWKVVSVAILRAGSSAPGLQLSLGWDQAWTRAQRSYDPAMVCVCLALLPASPVASGEEAGEWEAAQTN